VPRGLKQEARPAGLIGAAAARGMSKPTPIVLFLVGIGLGLFWLRIFGIESLQYTMGASDFDMFSRIWRLSLRHCKTSKFKLRDRRSLIGPPLRRHRAFVAGMSATRELRRRMRGLRFLLGRSKGYPNPHWIALAFHSVARMQNCGV
jgi:hypothetical protein